VKDDELAEIRERVSESVIWQDDLEHLLAEVERLRKENVALSYVVKALRQENAAWRAASDQVVAKIDAVLAADADD
jgi:predicted  nucleic acid-binding Zn-ribbon protein